MTEGPLEVGKKAPAFTLKDENDDTVQLSDLTGEWVVLYFYPRDDTPGCTVEAKEFTTLLTRFKKLDARVLGCSPDSPETHQEFRKKYRLRVSLLSDPDHKVMAKYGAWGKKNMYGRITEGVIRSTVIIDPKGRVAHRYAKVKAQGHAKAVEDRLRELQESD